MLGRNLDRILDRALDRALKASEGRHEAFLTGHREDRKRFEAEQERSRREFEREMERRYRDEVQITREFMRRNELVFQEGMRTLAGLVEATKELRDDIRAQRQGFLALLDRLDNGGEAAAQ